MKTALIFLFFLFCVPYITRAQNQERLCIFFDEDNKYTSINVNTSENPKIKATFSILKEGFETKEKKEKAMEEYRKNIFYETAFPVYYISFISMDEPEKFRSIEEIKCLYCISVNEFRKKNYRVPIGVKGFYIIYKTEKNEYLKWNVMMMMEE